MSCTGTKRIRTSVPFREKDRTLVPLGFQSDLHYGRLDFSNADIVLFRTSVRSDFKSDSDYDRSIYRDSDFEH
jgi:hypothetical protein